jgi:transcriptional regulator with XRE-family HTH domain
MLMQRSDTRQLVAKFKEFVLEQDLTLQQTALSLKMSHSAVADILSGKTENPHERTLYKIKKLIGENKVSEKPV